MISEHAETPEIEQELFSAEEIRKRQFSDPAVQEQIEKARRRVKEGRTKPGKTAEELLDHRHAR